MTRPGGNYIWGQGIGSGIEASFRLAAVAFIALAHLRYNKGASFMVAQQVKFALTQLGNPAWFKDIQKSSIWISAYRMFCVSPDFPQRPEIIDFACHRLVFIRGTITYQDSHGTLTVVNENPFTLNFEYLGEKMTPDGHYVLVIAPHSIDGENADEAGLVATSQVAIGHIRACLGKNAAFQHIFDNILHLGSDKTEVTSQGFEMPSWHPPVNMEPSERTRFLAVGQAIDNLPVNLKTRAKFALSWFNRGQSASDPVEAFINCWVALECFSDSDTHIKPLNQMLAQAYASTLNDVTGKFGLGRLQGLRSDIIHKGRTPVLDGLLQMYVEAIFRDLLCEFLSLPCPKRADAILDHSRERLAPYIGAG